MSDIATAYNSNWSRELKFVSDKDKSSNEYIDEFYNNKNFKETKDLNKLYLGIDELDKKLNIEIDNQQAYSDLLEEDKMVFHALNFRANFLFGKRGDIGKKIVNNQLSYYEKELDNSKSSLAGDYALRALFTIWKDNITLNNFSDRIGNSTDAVYISKYFGDLAPLEKYANINYKFEKEDLINDYYPNYLSKIKNWKKYFASYYTAEKDFSIGNTQTAQLELQAVIDNSANSVIDYNSIFNERDSINLASSKDILKFVSNQAALIKEYKEKELYKYPFLSNIDLWKDDLVLCQMYHYKAGIFNSLTSKYPSSKNVTDLIQEVSKINPKTDYVDNKFDKSTMKFKNTDKEMEFICIDKYSKEELKYTIIKR